MEFIKESLELKNIIGALACFGALLMACVVPELIFNLICEVL